MKFYLILGMALLFGTVLIGCGSGNGGNVASTRSVSLTLADHLTLTEDTTRASIGTFEQTGALTVTVR